MKILTKAEGEQLLLKKNFSTDIGELRFFYKTYIAYELPNPPITLTQIALAENLIKLLREICSDDESEGVFWITDRDVFHDNIFLFDGYRKSLNETRKLEEAPFHVFDKSDLNDLECLLELAFYFGFFALLILPKKETIFYINEEWFIDVTCKNKNDYSFYRNLFEGLKLKEVKKK